MPQISAKHPAPHGMGSLDRLIVAQVVFSDASLNFSCGVCPYACSVYAISVGLCAIIFIELPAFSHQELFEDEALRAIQVELVANPEAGDLIPGGHGLRKLRAASSGRGKRGGARVIYYWWRSRDTCYLVYAYAKNRQENLTPMQTRLLAAAMKEVLSHE